MKFFLKIYFAQNKGMTKLSNQTTELFQSTDDFLRGKKEFCGWVAGDKYRFFSFFLKCTSLDNTVAH